MAKDKVIRSNGAIRRSRSNLAIWLRENLHESVITDWYMAILSGKDAIIVADKRCTQTGGYRVEIPERGNIPPTLDQKFRAMEDLLQRRDGMPAQHVTLEAEVRAHMAAGDGAVDKEQLSTLTPEKLMALRELLRPALPAGRSSEPAVDAEEVLEPATGVPDEPPSPRELTQNMVQDAELVDITPEFEE